MSPALIGSRVAASLLGGYAFVWGSMALGVAAAMAAGMPYGQAQTLTNLFAFLVFLAAFCWAYAAPSVARVWGVLAGGGTAMTGAAWLLLRLG